MNLTSLELAAFKAIAQTNMDNVGAGKFEDFQSDRCFVCDVRDVAAGIGSNPRVVRGVISSLVQKGLVFVEDVDVNGQSNLWYDFTNEGDAMYLEMEKANG